MADLLPDDAPRGDSPEIEVRRSARRRRTVAAYRDGEKIVILMPARTPKAEEERLVAEMVGRITRREAKLSRSGPRASDRALVTRASQLSIDHLDGLARPTSVRWVTNMNRRWGSCTTTDGSIRLSHRLQAMPSWVIDYVLVHELSHLLQAGHGPEFWAWVNKYPRTERARGYLEGIATAVQLPGFVPGESGSSELPDCDWPEPESSDSVLSDSALLDSASSD